MGVLILKPSLRVHPLHGRLTTIEAAEMASKRYFAMLFLAFVPAAGRFALAA